MEEKMMDIIVSKEEEGEYVVISEGESNSLYDMYNTVKEIIPKAKLVTVNKAEYESAMDDIVARNELLENCGV